MTTTHNHENYHDQDPSDSSKLKRLARSLGRAAGRALSAFDKTSGDMLYAEFYPPVKEKDEADQLSVGRPIRLPAIYNYDNNRKTQSVYLGRMYDKKGESAIPLDLLWEHDMLIAIYSMKNNANRRYLVVQQSPELQSDGPSSEEKVKFSEVYEYPKAEERFTCRNRESTIYDPELLQSLIIGGNYGAGSILVGVLGLTPEHEATFYDDSNQEERSLAYSIYQLERALLEHETKINSRFV